MKTTTRVTAMILGHYAGLLGMEHSAFGFLQGNHWPPGLMVHAIGPPHQPAEMGQIRALYEKVLSGQYP